MTKPYPPGIHVPSLTFFRNNARQDIDWEVQETHMEFLISSGLHGIVLAGSNGEAVTLSVSEKCELIRRTRDIATKVGRPDIPLTLGCGGGCTRDVIDQTIQAKEAGTDFALVLIPSFFHFAIDEEAIISFFKEVADASPIPIVIYNFPGVTAGLDVNSDIIDALGDHPNIVGVKFTCGGIAKVARAAAAFPPEQFSVLAGQGDWLIPAMSVGGKGCITGLANLYPRTCVEAFNLQSSGKLEEAEKLQLRIAVAELGLGKGGINGTKWVVAKFRGYPDSSAACRRPYPLYKDKGKQDMIVSRMKTLEDIEKALVK
ncbi:hypothetical protein FQN54_005799 [Arachnomyces sp. PD_36]|nr:hypothetical protein FQN54_005799 [Arachnomyces sp. PD_36]